MKYKIRTGRRLRKMNKLKEMDGNEIWTNAFGDRFEERVCVLVKYPFCVHNGEQFKPIKQESSNYYENYNFFFHCLLT